LPISLKTQKSVLNNLLTASTILSKTELTYFKKKVKDNGVCILKLNRRRPKQTNKLKRDYFNYR